VDQNSQSPSKPDRGELSLVRRLFRALGNHRRKGHRNSAAFGNGPVELLEVRQVLSGQPISVLASPIDAEPVRLAEKLTAEELTVDDVIFVSATLQQVTSALQSLGWTVPTSMASSTDVAHVRPPFDPSLIESEQAIDPRISSAHRDLKERQDEEPLDESIEGFLPEEDYHAGSIDTTFVHDGEVLIRLDDELPREQSTVDVPPAVSPPLPPQQLPDAQTSDVGPDRNQSPNFAEPARDPQFTPARDLRLQIRFDWDSLQSGLAIEQPNESTLLIIVRGSNSDIIPESRRQLLQDSISKATAELVQTISATTDVRISLFTDFSSATDELWQTNSAASHDRLDGSQTVERCVDSFVEETRESTQTTRDAVAGSLTVEGLSPFESGPLDSIFEDIDGLLLTNTLSEPLNAWVPPVPVRASKSSASESNAALATTSILLIHPPSEDSEHPVTLNLTDPTLASSALTPLNVAAITFVSEPAETHISDSGDVRRTTSSRALLKLLFAKTDDNVISSESVVSGAMFAETSSSQSTNSSTAVQAKRQRQSQQDSSAAASLWRDSDNEQPPIPTSDGSPREVQFADRSRGPPLLRSARDDLLTDYEAPAGLLERLRYSISPRGPSLVTVDVQLPETVLFGAES
jgi:hypothetical protein